MKACKDCGSVGEPKTATRGSMGVEVILWLCFLVPGLIYSIWRLSSKHDVCAACGSENLVPLASPAGKQFAAQAGVPPEAVIRPSAGAVSTGRLLGQMVSRLMR